ncbi:MAG: YceI family protein [Burkholderiales bacterium]|nr:YceI family protein [Burkholderiales bacterium]MDE2395180.1 YceI family protein [Burkholderiales bacterium]
MRGGLTAPAAACAVALAATFTVAPAGAAPLEYTLDPDHCFAWFDLLHFGTSTLRGRFGPIRGEVVLDREAGRGEAALRIDMRTLSTGIALLDARLAAADLLDSSASPQAFYVSRQFRFEGGRPVVLRGELTLRGKSRPLELHALRFACRELDEPRREVCGGDFEASLLRSDYGMTFGLPFVADRVRLQIEVEGWRPLDGPRPAPSQAAGSAPGR